MTSTTTGKEILVIAFDVSKSMGTHSPQIIQQAKQVISNIIKGKLQDASKDEVGIMLFGSKTTFNPLNETDTETFKNIQILDNIRGVHLDMFRSIDKNIDPDHISGSSNADFFEALIVAAHLIQEKCGSKKSFKKRIMIITDASSRASFNSITEYNAVYNSLQTSATAVTTICVGEKQFDEQLTIEKILEDEKYYAANMRRANLFLLHHLSKGFLVDLDEAAESLTYLRAKGVMQRAMFAGEFEISDQLKIPIKVFKKTDNTKFPSAKKASKFSETSTVTVSKSYFLADNPDEEVPQDKLVKAYRYGKNTVPFNEADIANMLKTQSDRCLQLLYFCEKQQVPRDYYMDCTFLAISPTDDMEAQQALSMLIRSLYEKDRVAIVRYVSRNNAEPKLAVLLPHIKDEYECFYLEVLPFSEDVRDYSFRSFSNVSLSSAQLQATEDLIQSMDLTQQEKDSEGNALESYKMSTVFHPILQHFNNCLHHRALYPKDSQLPQLDSIISKVCFPEINSESVYSKMMNANAKQVKEFATQFPTEKVETNKDKKAKKRYWFAVDESISLESYNQTNEEEEVLASEQLERVKRLKTGNEDENQPMIGIDNIFIDKADSVSTVNPVKDFKEMMERRDVDLVERAIDEMQKIIMKLISDSIGDQFYVKALQCVIVLREACIKEEESNSFNDFLKKLKISFGQVNSKRKAFWDDYIRVKKVTLISAEEAADSELTSTECNEFLEQESQPVQEQVVQQEVTEEDALYDDLQ